MGDFTSFWKKKKTKEGVIPILRIERSIAPHRIGPAQLPGHAAKEGHARGRLAEYTSLRGRRLTRIPPPLKRWGPPAESLTRGAHPQGRLLPPAPATEGIEAAGERRPSLAPGGTGHLRRCPAHRRTQRAAAHPSRCFTPAGEPGKRRSFGCGGPGRRRGWT